ncbi:MAG: hypothetical protein Q8859_00620 [Bacteroidota bacterium]|nr:hypothetical protein [Bacteroidota bacterium]
MAVKEFIYKPDDHELEKAANSYLMSMIALMAGLPLPIINLIATFIFFLGNRKGTYFVRWHCCQALFSQATIVFVNSFCFYRTMSIIFGSAKVTNSYIAYLITVIVFNIIEFIITIQAAVYIRKGKHIEWWFFGTLAQLICKK